MFEFSASQDRWRADNRGLAMTAVGRANVAALLYSDSNALLGYKPVRAI